ncbi:hypothetical protein E4U24_003333 [Claviceps purpurea]|nr:hypothetical protein E4U24_003333 [Claviceps purpurea]
MCDGVRHSGTATDRRRRSQDLAETCQPVGGKAPVPAIDARPRASFADGTRFETLDGHTYRIHLHADFCVGAVLDHAPWFVASSPRRNVLAYTNHVEFAAFTGLSIPTGYEETAAAMMPAVPDFNLFKTIGTDGVWAKGLLPNNPIRKGSPEHWFMLIPRHGPLTPGVCDIWISATAGQALMQAALSTSWTPFHSNFSFFSLRQDTSTQ